MYRQSGNVLFMILIGVFLFAALSYAVTQSSRGGNSAPDSENLNIAASRIISFSNTFTSSVQRMMILTGKQPYELDYSNDIYKNYDGSLVYTALGSPADPTLYVFHPLGGGVSPQTFEDLSIPCPGTCAATSPAGGHFNLIYAAIPQLGTTKGDAMMVIWSLSKEVCQKINDILGVTGTPAANLKGSNLVGLTSVPTPPTPTGTGITNLTGKMEFCFQQDNGGFRYQFVKVFQVN